MPFEKSYDRPEAITEPACIHLRSKAMYVTGDFNPKHPDEAGSHYCWCKRNQHVIGPDNLAVNRAECIPGRSCYVAR
jgi:hypothetical protein